jgi:hypothetical protein
VRPACAEPVAVTLAPGDSLVHQEVWRAVRGGGTAEAVPAGPYAEWAFGGGPTPGGDTFVVRAEELLVLRVLPAAP